MTEEPEKVRRENSKKEAAEPVLDQPMVEPDEVLKSEVELVTTSPLIEEEKSPVEESKPKKPRAPRKTEPSVEIDTSSIVPVNLEAEFDQVAEEETIELPKETEEEGLMEVDEAEDDVSIVDEFEEIANEQERELAYQARKVLKDELHTSAKTMVHEYLGDQFSEDQKEKIGSLVTRFYDDPKTLFEAIKNANKGELKNPYKQLGNIKLLDASKSISKEKSTKIEGFKQFLAERMKLA